MQRARKLNFRSASEHYFPFFFLVAIVVLFSLWSETFLSVENLMNIARQISLTGIIAVGMALVIIAGGIDFSVGSISALTGVIAALAMTRYQLPTGVAAGLAMALSLVLGAVNGLIVVRLRVVPWLATIITMTIFNGCSVLISGGLPVFGLPKDFSFLGQGYVGIFPMPMLIFIAVAAVGSFILRRTYYGRFFFAIGENEAAASLAGLHVRSLKVLSFILCGFCAGLAGLVILSRISSAQPAGTPAVELDVIAAVLIGGISIRGGKGSMSGAISGVLIIGVLSNGLMLLNVASYFQTIIKGIVLLVAIWIDGLPVGNLLVGRTLIEK